MERLTARNEKGGAYYPGCFEEPCCGEGCKIDNCELARKQCERLAAYEDLGVTPEQIREIDKLYGEKCRELAEVKKSYEEKKRNIAETGFDEARVNAARQIGFLK